MNNDINKVINVQNEYNRLLKIISTLPKIYGKICRINFKQHHRLLTDNVVHVKTSYCID